MDKKNNVYEGTTEPIDAKNWFQINRQTLPLKTTLFFYFGAMSALLPYLTIHMQAIGISIQETAVIYGILPITSFLGPPMMGFLADKLGRYKIVLIISTIANGLFHVLLLAVPVYREQMATGTTLLQLQQASNFAYIEPTNLQDLQLCDAFMRNLTDVEEIKAEISNCIPHFVNKETNPSSFCNLDYDEADKLIVVCPDSIASAYNSYDSFNLTLRRNEMDSLNCTAKLKMQIVTDSNFTSITCETNFHFSTGEIIRIGNNSVTFWCYFLFRILASIFSSACFTLLDATTLAVVKKNSETEYGKERIWAILGMAIVSPIAGAMVDYVSRMKGYTDYSSAFYVAITLLFVNIITYFAMNLEVEKPEEEFGKNGIKLLKYPEVDIFLVMIFILGSMWGFVENYLFIFLKELHAPNYLLGLTLTVGSLTGIPFLYGAEKIVLKFGRVNLIVIAFLSYFVRFFGYSYIWNPFWCFPFEAMEAFTYHLMWVAAATYCGVLAPKGLLATLMGIVGSLHYSLGKGNGSFIGGYMLGIVGSRLSFRYFGVASGVFGLIYFAIHEIWLKKVVEKRLAVEANVSGDDVKVKDELLKQVPKNVPLSTLQKITEDEVKQTISP